MKRMRKKGVVKDESNGIPMKIFTGLNPKVYAYQTNDDKETRKAKGVSKMVLKRDIANSFVFLFSQIRGYTDQGTGDTQIR